MRGLRPGRHPHRLRFLRPPARAPAATLSARLSLVALTAPAWLLLGTRSTSRLHAERLVIWAVTVGLHPHHLEAVVRDFAAKHAGDDGGRRIDVTLQRLKEHQSAGDRVVIATACAEPLARDICRVLGLKDVEVIASTFTTHRWRLPHTVPARGHQKVQALIEAGFDLPVDHAYSDSLSDLPLLQAARTAHLVRPTRRDLPVLLRELGPDVEVIR